MCKILSILVQIDIKLTVSYSSAAHINFTARLLLSLPKLVVIRRVAIMSFSAHSLSSILSIHFKSTKFNLSIIFNKYLLPYIYVVTALLYYCITVLLL